MLLEPSISLRIFLIATIMLAHLASLESFSTRSLKNSMGHRLQNGCISSRQHHSKLKSATPPIETDESKYDRLSRVHKVVEKLKLQIPTLLTTPLTEASAKAVYDDDVTLVVDDIVLASSREELQSLSSTLVLAVLATNQANSFIANAVGRAAGPTNAQPPPSKLESSMAMDPTSSAIRVQWNVSLPGQTSDQKQQQVKGLSQLELDPDTGKVTNLRLLKIQFNQEQMNSRAIAESLSSLRQLVFAFQNSPFVPKSGLPSLSSLLGSDFMQQVSRQSPPSENDLESPLYVTENLATAFSSSNSTSPSSNATNYTTALIPIDDYVGKVASLPLPGSIFWNKYVAARRVYVAFRENTLRVLSGNVSMASSEMLDLFSPQVVLKATDGSELLRGRDSVGNFFHTLASFRKRSSGTWELLNATLLNYDESLTISVDYLATSLVPGSSSPVIFEGTDIFVVESPILKADSKENRADGEEDNDELEVLIRQVEQKKLQLKGGAVGSRSPDALSFMKGLVALDSGRLSSVGADSVVMDLLQRVISGDSGRAVVEPELKKKKRRRVPPKLDEKVAARVYTIMSGLHQELPALFEKDMLRTYQLPPLHEYMSKDVELRGYLGETLVRGLPSYNTALGTIFGTLKASLATGSANLEQDPSLSVELTSDGHVRVKIEVDLKVLPLPAGAGELINSMSGSAFNLPSGGFPLKFSVVSDYVLDKDTGDIYQHRVVETRINGQLTPGDVISRWIQKQASRDGVGTSDRAAAQRGLLDAISWVRSVGGRG